MLNVLAFASLFISCQHHAGMQEWSKVQPQMQKFPSSEVDDSNIHYATTTAGICTISRIPLPVKTNQVPTQKEGKGKQKWNIHTFFVTSTLPRAALISPLPMNSAKEKV